MLTARGRLALALGGLLYVAAWAFGSVPLYPVAAGLVLAVALAWGWVRVANRPLDLRRVAAGGEHMEGDDVPVAFELVPEGRFVPSTAVVVDRIAGLGATEVEARRSRRGTLTGRYVLPAMPRGRYPYESTTVAFEDPFGLERAETTVAGSGALLVYPRLVELEALFTESGASAEGGRRLLLRRPTGFDLHSVRDHQRGESLRKVHWATTARRGRLMVKELEDEPRDEVAVLLDAAAGVVAGTPPDSSFDAQVRAAGSLLRAHARGGRRTALVINSAGRETLGLHGDDGDWRRALEALAAVEPNGRVSAASLLGEDASAAARALDLTVVTANVTPELTDRLVQRAASRRGTALVYVHAPSFAGSTEPVREPALLRLQASGVPVAVLRRGDDLAPVLTGVRAPEAAHG
ncbi:MAG TPA: DUF58 domain-containing protein [Gaiellaceae bacterium]|nr:DUF58 domain-containing protein [Gaiellaceae bacterium]